MKFIDLPLELHPSLENYDKEMTRLAETVRCHLLLHVAQAKPGRFVSAIKTQSDRMIYTEALVVALKVPVNFKSTSIGDALQSADVHFFEIYVEAMQDIQRAKQGLPYSQMHAAALLAAKLDMENILGRVPTRAETKENAAHIFSHRFNRPSHPLMNYKDWDKAFTAAFLDYLPRK